MNTSILMTVTIPSIIALVGITLIIVKKSFYLQKNDIQKESINNKKLAVYQGISLIIFALYLVLIHFFLNKELVYFTFIVLGLFAFNRLQLLLYKWCKIDK